MATTNRDFRVKNGLTVEGDISSSGVLKSNNSAANEGGEIQLALPSSGSTLTSGVTIDVYQNKLRIFETGGDNQGAYIDLSAAAAGVGSNLLSGGGGLSNVVEDTTPQLGGNLDAQGYNITNVDYIGLDTTPASTPTAQGNFFWDSGEGSPVLILDSTNGVNLKLGQQNVALCYNGTGSTIAKGAVVYISGAQGQKPSITLSDADTEATSSKTFGVTSQSIANGADGYVCTFGIVNGIDTSAFTAGDALWLSSTAGGLTATPPAEPAHLVFVGYCLSSHATAGRIFVNPQNGYELNELHGVLIDGTPADNEVLAYDTTSGLWINQTASEAGLEPTITAGTTSQYWRGDKSWQTLDKTAVGLSNVENTALSTWAGSTNITTVGAITATSVNKVTITAPATSATLTIANGKTLTVNNSITMSGTDATTMTFPSTSQSIAGLGVTGQVFTTAQIFRASSAVRSEAASTQDAVVLAGRAGGTSSFAVTLTPTTLGANRTVTLPDATGTALISQSAAAAGYFDTSATTPSGTTRLNYGGYLYATRFYGDGSNISAINATNISTGTLTGNVGVTAGSASSSFVEYNGTTKTAGQWDGGTTDPSSTTRLNYDGYLYATRFYGDGSNLTNISTNSTFFLTPTIVGESSGDFTTATTGTLTLPLTQEGDVVIVQVSSLGAAPALPAGWTNLSSAANGTTLYQRVMYKVMGATPDTSVALTNLATRSDAIAIAIRNVDTTTPVDTTNSVFATTGSSTTPDPAAVTTQYNNQLALVLGAQRTSVTGVTPPTGYINSQYIASGTTSPVTTFFASKNIATAASENPGTFTMTGGTSSVWITNTFLVNRKSVTGINAGYVANTKVSTEEVMTIALSDDANTSITTGTSKAVIRAPFAMKLTKIPRASLKGVSSPTAVTVDINANGVSILSTKLTIDSNELSSTTAAIPAVLSQDFFEDDAEITFDIDSTGAGADGLKVTLYYERVV